MSKDLKGVFFIIKGSYTHKLEPSFINPRTNTLNWLGGYDPRNTPQEWYILIDRVTYTCMAGGSDYNKILEALYNTITKYKTLGNYLKVVEKLSQERFYDEKNDQPIKASGTCSMMIELYKEIERRWGDYFADDIEEVEMRASNYLREHTPLRQAKKRMKKKLTPAVMEQAPKKSTEVNTAFSKINKRNKSVLKLQCAME